MFVAGREHRGARQFQVGEHGGSRRRQRAGTREVDRRLERERRHIVVNLTVGQGERREPEGPACRQHLGERATRVVPNDIERPRPELLDEHVDKGNQRVRQTAE